MLRLRRLWAIGYGLRRALRTTNDQRLTTNRLLRHYERIEYLVHVLAVLDCTPAQVTLDHEPRLFEHTARRPVVRQRHCEHTGQIVVFDGVLGDGAERLRADSAAPVLFSEPVPDFSRHPLDVLLKHEA